MHYSERLLDHFFHPRNVGVLPDANRVGQIGDPSCGDFLKVWIKVKNNVITDIRFLCQGCPAAIALASVMTEMARGRTLEEAADITDEKIAEAIGPIPEWKLHCSNLGASALHAAILDYLMHALQEETMPLDVQRDKRTSRVRKGRSASGETMQRGQRGEVIRMERFLAAICRICPVCIARRRWPKSAFGRFMEKIEALCPFCRAYDRLMEEADSKPDN